MTIPVFDPDHPWSDLAVTRLGDGPLGSESEALATLGRRLSAGELAGENPGIAFRVARTIVLTGPGEAAVSAIDSPEPRLGALLRSLPGPLRVRAARGRHPGYVPPERADDDPAGLGLPPPDRLRALRHALEVVRGRSPGASTLAIQEVVGRRYGKRHYPHIGGCLLGENHYPIAYMKPGDGVAYLVLGLGEAIERDRSALRFSPRHPDLMPDFSMPADVLRNAQRSFRALPLDATTAYAAFEPASFDLRIAAEDGTLAPVGGVVSLENETIYPGVHRPGVKVVTFASLLRGHPFPIAAVLRELLELAREEIGGPPRIELAVNLAGRGGGTHELVVEAVEPLDAHEVNAEPVPDDPGVICTSTSALGHGRIAHLTDIVYVSPARFDPAHTPEMAREIKEMAGWIVEQGRRFVLIGSGRWGSTDRSLGIPVTWSDIAGAAVQVEAALEGFNIESSRGTHFFRELTVAGVGYLHVSLQTPGDAIHWDRLDALPAEHEATFVRHLRLARPLDVRIDGRSGRGVIRLPD